MTCSTFALIIAVPVGPLKTVNFNQESRYKGYVKDSKTDTILL